MGSASRSHPGGCRGYNGRVKIAVIGGTGRAGSRIVARLAATGHEAVAASPSTGVDTLTGAGLDGVLAGTGVVIDVSNASGGDPVAYFTRSTHTLLGHAARQGVRHHVLLSVVGADRMTDSPYMRGKVQQEELVRRGAIRYSIVRATQFHEFIPAIADAFADGDGVRVPACDMQPVALDDVAEVIVSVAGGEPLERTIEIAGPEAMPMAEAVRRSLRSGGEQRLVETDPEVRYFGARVERDTLLPGRGARIGHIRLA